jgi:hypothetical protein
MYDGAEFVEVVGKARPDGGGVDRDEIIAVDARLLVGRAERMGEFVGDDEFGVPARDPYALRPALHADRGRIFGGGAFDGDEVGLGGAGKAPDGGDARPFCAGFEKAAFILLADICGERDGQKTARPFAGAEAEALEPVGVEDHVVDDDVALGIARKAPAGMFGQRDMRRGLAIGCVVEKSTGLDCANAGKGQKRDQTKPVHDCPLAATAQPIIATMSSALHASDVMLIDQ